GRARRSNPRLRVYRGALDFAAAAAASCAFASCEVFDMVHATAFLRCADPSCGATLDAGDRRLHCPRCGDLLDVVVPGPAADARTLVGVWEERRRSHAQADASGVWRFREFLPEYPSGAIVTLGEGNTPLLEAPRRAAAAGVRRLWFKHLGWNPTGSFKD